MSSKHSWVRQSQPRRRITPMPARDTGVPALTARGRGTAITRLNGVNRSEVTTILEDFRRLPPEARAAFAHTWITRTAARLEETWPVFYQLLKIVEEEGIYKKAIVLDRTRESATYPNFQAYWEQEVKRPFTEWAELEQTYQFV